MNAPMYLLCVGRTYYTKESFKQEADRLGISRRLSSVPKDLVLGQSKVLCAFEATKNSHPKRCKFCMEPGGKSKWPVVLWTLADGTKQARCINTDCQRVHPIRQHEACKVPCYFIPNRIELVIVASEEQARNAARFAHELGVLSANLVDSDDTLRMELSFGADAKSDEFATALATMSGVTVDAKMIASAIGAGAGVTFVAREPRRGCGTRRPGIYARGDADFPLVSITPPVAYEGQHFRGLKRLDEQTAIEVEEHLAGQRLGTIPEGEREDVPPLLGAAD